MDEAQAAEKAWVRRDSGLPTLMVVSRALRLRAARPGLFRGSYEPLPVVGPKADHAIAFMRGGGAITVVPRLVHRLAGDWGETTVVELPAAEWRDVFTGGRYPCGLVRLGTVLGRLPVALLVRV